jgi:hypothetical protein
MNVDRSVAQIGDELYALPPAAFIGARDSYVARARSDADAAAARQLAALKRPTVVGFLVNLLALRRPEALDRFLALAERMRSATGAAQMRELSAERRREIDALLAVVTELTTEAGATAPTRTQLAEVESTLSAALVDDVAAELVRSGRVLKGLSYGGFGQLAGPEERAAEARESRREPERAPHPDEAHRAAQARVDAAREALDDARRDESRLADEAEDLAAEIKRLKEHLDAVTREARAARQARLAAERDLTSAERRLARVT